MKTLIFGGTFNPVHVGHLHILLKANEYIKADNIIVSIDKIPPWKKMGELIPYSYRETMVKNLFDNNIKYSIYPNSNNYVYTYQILQDIKNNINSDLYFLVGQDQYDLITTWNEYELINKLVTIVCYRRGGKPIKKWDDKHIILQDPEFDCSSTENRIEPKVEHLGKKNFDFIVANHFYPQDKVKEYMSKRRYEHTLRVVDTITQIAVSNHFSDQDIWNCQLAAYLHDIAKEYPENRLLELVSKEELDALPSWHCAHGIAGAKLAKRDFRITNELVLDAIANHVIFKDLNSNNKIAKALFCADKLEPARTKEDIEDREGHLKKCCLDLDNEFRVVYKQNEERY